MKTFWKAPEPAERSATWPPGQLPRAGVGSAIEAAPHDSVQSFQDKLPRSIQRWESRLVAVSKRLSHRWMLRGNFSWNDWTESCGAASIADPTLALGNCPGGQVAERSAGDRKS